MAAGYLPADLTTILLCIGLVLSRLGYDERYSGADVSLEPLEVTAQRLSAMITAPERVAVA